MGFSPIAWSRRKRLRPYLAALGVLALGAGAAVGASAASASTASPNAFAGYKAPSTVSSVLYRNNTTTPIKHVVVIFDENESFDHYFGTYPYAANTDGTTFTAKPGTPTVNGLYTKITKSGPVGPLLTSNPNEYNPQRLTSLRGAHLRPEPRLHAGAGRRRQRQDGQVRPGDRVLDSLRRLRPEYCPPGIVMDYYDGNTVTGLWNYAQNYAMSDNNYDTAFGPSTPGAINVTSGDTAGAKALNPTWDPTDPSGAATSTAVVDVNKTTGLGVLYGDNDPYYDACSDTNHTTNGSLGR
jgi:phospholipase C